MQDTIWLFSGQSSYHPSMFAQSLSLDEHLTRQVFSAATSLLGRDLMCWLEPTSSTLSSNKDLHVGVFLLNYVHQLFVEQLGIKAVASLGYSLGEYNHLVHIGALSFEEALCLVDARGRLFDAGPPGLMASVSGLSRDMLVPTLERASVAGHVEIGIYAAPSEHVISGEQTAVETALALLEAERRIIGQLLEPHTPIHSASFQPVASPLRPHLEALEWAPPSLPYISTISAKATPNASPRLIIEALAQHVYRPIQWVSSLEVVLRENPGACLLLLGPGNSLGKLMRGWVRAQSYHLSDKDTRKALYKVLQIPTPAPTPS